MEKELKDHFSFHIEISCICEVCQETGKHMKQVLSDELFCTDYYQTKFTNAVCVCVCCVPPPSCK